MSQAIDDVVEACVLLGQLFGECSLLNPSAFATLCLSALP